MTISRFRSKLYAAAKLLGDVQAATHNKPGKRIGRRIAGKITGRTIGALFK